MLATILILIGALGCHAILGYNVTIHVVTGGETSSVRPVTAGIPQGLILGPFLFILYVNGFVYEVNIAIRVYK